MSLPLVLVALALAACGGDDDDPAATGEPLSAEEYDTQTEAALLAIANLGELSSPLASPESVEQYVSGVREIVAEIDRTVADLEAIEPPESVASIHDQLIAAVEAYGAAFPPVADAAEAGDDAALRASAEELQTAALDFQATVTDLSQQFSDEGFELEILVG